jgi:serine protease Do
MNIERACFVAAALALATLGASSQGTRAQRETQVVRVVREVAPSVVYISSQQRVKNPFASPFWDLFGEDFPGGATPRGEENSLGSGVIIDPAGYVLTNEHVILGGSNIRVTLNDGRPFSARVVGSAPEMDLALLKMEGRGPFPSARLGRSDDLMIGETVVAVGNPFGLSNTVSVGVLSAVGRTVAAGDRQFSDFLQTDAPINPGNSGGPLLNILGEVIGVNTAIIRQAQSIGFAIPINRARRVMEQLKTYGKVRPIWLGVLVLDPSEPYKRRLGQSAGAVVARTYPFAYPQEGLRRDDFLTAVDGKTLDGAGDLNARMALLNPGQKVTLTGLRDGKRFSATLEARLMPDRLTPAMAWELLGLRLTSGERSLEVGAVRRGSPAEAVGLRSGDAILAVQDQPATTPEEFLAQARTALGSTGLPLSVGRGPWTYYVTLDLLSQ